MHLFPLFFFNRVQIYGVLLKKGIPVRAGGAFFFLIRQLATVFRKTTGKFYFL